MQTHTPNFTDVEIWTEEWRPSPIRPDAYEVSSLGRVRVNYKNGTSKIRSLWQNGRGYLYINMRDGEKVRALRVHRLIATAFDVPGEGTVVMHEDDNRANNRISNLRWGTPSENERAKVAAGRHPNASKTHCKRGHEFTDENTRFTRNGTNRNCRACERERGARRREENRILRVVTEDAAKSGLRNVHAKIKGDVVIISALVGSETRPTATARITPLEWYVKSAA
jgi:hypothetical protein